jgi:predicted pyridoxine 5'-phosphate oxidase superfamily flavin-nucleotide-binding protein
MKMRTLTSDMACSLSRRTLGGNPRIPQRGELPVKSARRARERAFTRRSRVAAGRRATLFAMKVPKDEPLPATMTFVFTIGVLILIGWFAMFALLRARW